MSVIRQANILGQQRLDVPHLRAIESSIAADFDLLAGRVLAGDKALVVRGMEIVTTNAVGNPATDLQLVVANSIILHSLASEHGTIFSVPSDQAVENLNSTNPNVSGSFTAGQVNYVGLDLRRVADDTTADLVQFMDANTLLETPKNVPLARTLQYKIVISTTDFSSTPNLLPICKVTTNSTNTVTLLEDARALNFRLGTGNSVPDKYHGFPWTAGRAENTSGAVFTGGDKGITSTKDWMDAVMTRLWEVGGGQYWYSATSDREAKLIGGAPTIVATSDNFQWTVGSNTLQWQSLVLVFGNSPVNNNTIVDGSATILDGQCLYVDIDRTTAAASLAKVGDLTTLGQSAIPGQRFIIAWRRGAEIFVKDHPYELGRSYPVANAVIDGLVKLKYVASNPADPLVLAMQTGGGFVNIADSANAAAFTGTGNGTGSGFFGTGGTSGGPGIKGQGGASGGRGGEFLGGASGQAAVFTGGSNAGGITITSGSGTGGVALTATATGNNNGANITAAGTGVGIAVVAAGSGSGITVSMGAGTGSAITATGGSGTTAALGIGADITGGGQHAIRATAVSGLFAAHAILAQGSNAGGGYGVKAFGGDINSSISTDDTTFNVGYGCALLGIGGQSFGGIGVAGYGGGTSSGHTPGSLVPDGQGGYFVGVASSFGSSDGLLSKGGAGSGAAAAGHGHVTRGGSNSGSASGGMGILSQGGASTTGPGGHGGQFVGGSGGGSGATAAGGSGIRAFGGTSTGGGQAFGAFLQGGAGSGGAAAQSLGGGGAFMQGSASNNGTTLDARHNTGSYSHGTFASWGSINVGGDGSTSSITNFSAWTDTNLTVASGGGSLHLTTVGDINKPALMAWAAAASATNGLAGKFILGVPGGSSVASVGICGVTSGGGTSYGIQSGLSPTSGNTWIAGDFNVNASAAGSGSTAVNAVNGGNGTAGTFTTNDSHSRGTICLTPRTGAPSAPQNGDIWVENSTIKVRLGGVTKTFTVT